MRPSASHVTSVGLRGFFFERDITDDTTVPSTLYFKAATVPITAMLPMTLRRVTSGLLTLFRGILNHFHSSDHKICWNLSLACRHSLAGYRNTSDYQRMIINNTKRLVVFRHFSTYQNRELAVLSHPNKIKYCIATHVNN